MPRGQPPSIALAQPFLPLAVEHGVGFGEDDRDAHGEGIAVERGADSFRVETRRVFSPVDLEIMGRSGTVEVVELPDDLPNVIGQIPLEFMDWVVDMRTHRLTGNPEHGGEWIDEEYGERREARE